MQTRKKWQGKIVAVGQHPDRCRVTIELSGTPAVTAALTKESLVVMEVLDGMDGCMDRELQSVGPKSS